MNSKMDSELVVGFLSRDCAIIGKFLINILADVDSTSMEVIHPIGSFNVIEEYILSIGFYQDKGRFINGRLNISLIEGNVNEGRLFPGNHRDVLFASDGLCYDSKGYYYVLSEKIPVDIILVAARVKKLVVLPSKKLSIITQQVPEHFRVVDSDGFNLTFETTFLKIKHPCIGVIIFPRPSPSIPLNDLVEQIIISKCGCFYQKIFFENGEQHLDMLLIIDNLGKCQRDSSSEGIAKRCTIS